MSDTKINLENAIRLGNENYGFVATHTLQSALDEIINLEAKVAQLEDRDARKPSGI